VSRIRHRYNPAPHFASHAQSLHVQPSSASPLFVNALGLNLARGEKRWKGLVHLSQGRQGLRRSGSFQVIFLLIRLEFAVRIPIRIESPVSSRVASSNVTDATDMDDSQEDVVSPIIFGHFHP
jgi:hypothetical protein